MLFFKWNLVGLQPEQVELQIADQTVVFLCKSSSSIPDVIVNSGMIESVDQTKVNVSQGTTDELKFKCIKFYNKLVVLLGKC